MHWMVPFDEDKAVLELALTMGCGDIVELLRRLGYRTVWCEHFRRVGYNWCRWGCV